MTGHLDFPANLESPLGNALYVIRLRHGSFRSGGQWINRTVAQRKATIDNELDRAKRHPWHQKRWQPPEGRESPREAWMSDRRNFTHYAFPGWMRFNHGKAPALVGGDKLYCLAPMSPEKRDFILRDNRRRYDGNQWPWNSRLAHTLAA